jgi:hypothetical protein
MVGTGGVRFTAQVLIKTKQMESKIEKEILAALLSIALGKENLDQYGRVGIFDYRESVLREKLSPEAFTHLKEGRSVYGKLWPYGGSVGEYYAVTLSDKFYTEKRIHQNQTSC